MVSLKNIETAWGDRLGSSFAITFLLSASIPGTVAFRYVLLALSLGFILFGQDVDVVMRMWREARWSSRFFVAFLLWGLFHTLVLAHWPTYAWGEYRSQLVVAFLWAVVGWGLFRRRRSVSILDAVMIAGALTALAEFCFEAWSWHVTGKWPFLETFITPTHLEFTFLMNMVLGFIFVTICFGYKNGKRITCFPRWALLLFAALILFVSMRVAARNGMIGLVYMSLSLLAVFLLFEGQQLGRKKCLAIAAGVLISLSSLSIYAVDKDQRNSTFVGSVEAGWNFQKTRAWLGVEPLPRMPDGRQVDDSAYKRVAWIHSGLLLIAQEPLGYGYGRGAFSRALTWQGYANRIGHSHSGMIDLGVGLGVPGILLWLAYCVSLVAVGFTRFAKSRDTVGLVLAMVSSGFIGRMLIESIQRDHMLYLFVFISSGLLAEMNVRSDACPHE